MGRTCGEPDEIELAAMGVKLNGSRRRHLVARRPHARGTEQPRPRRSVQRDGDGGGRVGTRHEPFNSTPMGVTSISPGSPRVRPTGRTFGEHDEINKNTHPTYITALSRHQVRWRQPARARDRRKRTG